RDLFAPLAAQLLNGVTIEALGTAAALPTPDRPQPLLPGEQRSVEIVWVDRFGNLVVDLHRDQLKDGAPESLVVQSGDVQISGLRRDYQAPDGRPFAVIGSSGYLEIACRERSAATTLGRGVGDSINVARPGSASTKGS
ncbi:MAG: SAM-dependent chlorinase/fluorinase, partial [Acidobacteriota bacterium]|nr:SAM-dependent chlorinase/fluorinase [Acidobacteriota bacterium]